MSELDTVTLARPGSASRRSLFRGVGPIFFEKRRLFTRVPLWVGLPSGLITGFLARVNHAASDDLVAIAFVALCTCAALAPLLGAAFVTVSGGQVGGRPRREELLSLPIGRLAIPAATLLASLTLALATYGLFLAGLSFFLGHEKALDAVLAGPIERGMPFTLLGRCKGALGVFAGAWAAATIASGPSNSVFLAFCLMATGLAVFPGFAGHEHATTVSSAKLWLACMTSYALVLPFVLYSRSPHHWSVVRPMKIRWAPRAAVVALGPGSALGFASLGALGFLGVMGMGKGVVIALALGGLAALRAWRNLPPAERRQPSQAAVTLVLGFAFIAPAVVTALVVDARHYAAAARPVPEALASYSVSPDGRFVVACFRPDGDKGLSRVLVADVTGKEPARALPLRFAELDEVCCWSKDGRYLAVHETARGRVTVPGSNTVTAPWQFGAEVKGLDQLGERIAETLERRFEGTWILDTQTGSLEERGLLVLAPGWSSPDELLQLSPRTLGGCDLEDGRGHSVLWDKPLLAVEAYTSAGADLGTQNELFELTTSGAGASSLAPVASGSRWEGSGGHPYTLPGGDHDRPDERWDFTFTKGARSITARGCKSSIPNWLDERTVILFLDSGVTRLDLETGERTLVLGPEEKRHDLDHGGLWFMRMQGGEDRGVRVLGEGSCEIVWTTGETYSLVDLRTGARTPLPKIPADFYPKLVRGKRLFGKKAPSKSLFVLEGTGEPRPIFQE